MVTQTKKMKNPSTDFPRGGASTLTPLEKRTVVDQAHLDAPMVDAESLFQETTTNKKKRSASKLTGNKQPKKFKASTESANLLSFKKLHRDMTLLGCIKQISELGLTVSLPHQLTGFVSITEITSFLSKQISAAVEGEDDEDLNIPDLNQYFSIGQMVPCTVVDVQEEPRRRLDLSLKPELVNASITASNVFPGMLLSGMIVSKQDHGYEVHLGIDQLTAFVNFKNIPKDMELCLGQYQYFHVIKAGKVVQLSLKDVYASKIASKQSIPFDSLKAGMAVEVIVESHLKNGLAVRFNDVFEGTIDWFHLNSVIDNEETLQKKFKVNQTLTARIIMVDTDTKKIALSLLPNVMELNQPTFSVEYGGMVSVLVERVDASQGLLVNGGDCGLGYIHISKVADEKTDLDDFAIGSVHSARVIGFDYLQNLVLFSTSQKVLESPFLRATDVKPGMLLKGTVTVLNDKGAAIQLTDSISGWIPKNQMMETALHSIPAKFKEGANIKCRVLYVDTEKKRVYLTAKKTLVSSKLDPIVSYDSTAIGHITHGVIVGKGPYGVIVQFYNQVKALATMKDLGYGVSLSTLNVGQAVKCRVLSVNPENEQMRVSLNLVGVDIATDALDAMTVGKIMSGTILVIEKDSLVIKLNNDFGLSVNGILYTSHLADYPSLIDFQLKNLQEGQIIEDVAVIAKDLERGRIFLSKKPSILKALKEQTMPFTVSDLQVGQVVPGFVSKIAEDYAVVSFLGALRGVVKQQNVSDAFVSQLEDYLALGQSVYAKILTTEESTGKVQLSLKASDCGETEYSKELFRQMSLDKKSTELAPGTRFEGLIQKVHPDRVDIELPNGKVGQLYETGSFKTFAKYSCSILDSHPKGITLTSLETTSLNKALAKKLSQSASDTFESTVELIHRDYLVVRLSELSLVAFVVSPSFNSKKSLDQLYKLKQSLTVSIVHVPELQDSFPRIIAVPHHIKSKKSAASSQDLEIGKKVQVRVTSVHEQFIKVSLGHKVNGQVYMTDMDNSPSEYKSGQVLDAKILQKDGKKNIDLTIRAAALALPDGQLMPKITELVEGSIYEGRIRSVEPFGLKIAFGAHLCAFCPLIETTGDFTIMKNIEGYFKVGQVVKCTPTQRKDHLKIPHASIRRVNSEGQIQPIIQVGQKTIGTVVKIHADSGLIVSIAEDTFGQVHLTDLSDDYVSNPTLAYSIGDVVQCLILEQKEKIFLSLRGSRVNGLSQNIKNKEIASASDLKEGDVVSGYIKTQSNGVFVTLGRQVVGRVKISELSDQFIKEWQSLYKIGQLVQGKIIHINSQTGRIEMTLKESVVMGKPDGIQFSELSEGQTLECVIKKIERYGLFLRICGSNISGLCHISEISDNEVPKSLEGYSVGDKVVAVILNLDAEKQKVGFGLKPSYFTEALLGEDKNMDMTLSIANEHLESEEEDEAMEEAAPLEVEEFKWDIVDEEKSMSLMNMEEESEEEQEDEEEDSDEDELTESKKKKHSRREKEKLKKLAEQQAKLAEEALMDGNKAPENADDYERILLGSPNSSYVWIKYMAFYLQLSELDRARDIAERALKQISFREQEEKLNVWVAYLNLENAYGSPASLKTIFERSLAVNEPKVMYLHMVQIYEASHKTAMAEECYETMIKKFRESCKIWLAYLLFYIKSDMSRARELLKKSLQALPKRKHVKMVSKFAQLEYKHGEAERGRTLFEGILSNNPKRVDIWNVYLDKEIQSNQPAQIRRLFERAITMKFSSKKMKFFFKKYLDFEKTYGTPETVSHVKEAAMNYVQRL